MRTRLWAESYTKFNSIPSQPKPGDGLLCGVNTPLVYGWFELVGMRLDRKIFGSVLQGQQRVVVGAVQPYPVGGEFSGAAQHVFDRQFHATEV